MFRVPNLANRCGDLGTAFSLDSTVVKIDEEGATMVTTGGKNKRRGLVDVAVIQSSQHKGSVRD